MAVIPELKWQRQEDQKFRCLLCAFKTAWVHGNEFSKYGGEGVAGGVMKRQRDRDIAPQTKESDHEDTAGT